MLSPRDERKFIIAFFVDDTPIGKMAAPDYSPLLSETRAAFASGKTRPMAWRLQQLRLALTMIEENEDDIVAALYEDLRKPRNESISLETEYTKNSIRGFLIGLQSGGWARDEHVEKNMLTLMDTTYIHKEPYGVCLVIGPWNYPFQLAMVPALGAIAAGNAVVIKPSELAPASAEVMKRLVHKYLDSGV